MKQQNAELRLAALTIVLLTLGYIMFSVRLGTTPAPGGLAGHLLGAVGFIFMLMTETLYSIRKRQKHARWGSMHWWLRFHVFTGLVGPYMVLLHTSWEFHGLAGIVTLLTLVIVLSGLIGRYVYTAVPRNPEGAELASGDLQSEISTVEAEVKGWLTANASAGVVLPADVISLPSMSYSTMALVFGRPFVEQRYRWRWWVTTRHLKGTAGNQLRVLGRLLTRRRELHYRVATLGFMRRGLALWHSVHVPLGVALFTTAFIHAGAALYFVTLAR